MVVKKRPSNAANFNNFRPNERSDANKMGTRLTAEPTSVKDVLTFVVLHCCKKSIFFDIRLKVAIYLCALFLISLISDFLPMPKTYFSYTDNILNRYFVKFAWAWNLVLLLPFVSLTSLVGCCGDVRLTLKKHLTRVLIATACWYFFTVIVFNTIERNYGRCLASRKIDGENRTLTPPSFYQSRADCLAVGHYWHGFDLSGHCFILIYGSLFLIEEASAIVGWENIKDFVRFEEHHRTNNDHGVSSNPLRNLTHQQLTIVRFLYTKFTPFVYALFVAITFIQLLWDIMLVATLLYYHIMVEKFIAGVIAIFAWYFTYKFMYALNVTVLPNSPGSVLFKYKDAMRSASFARGTRTVDNTLPRFMGMPLYGLKKQEDTELSREAS